MSHIELERQAMNLSAQGRAELVHKLLKKLEGRKRRGTRTTSDIGSYAAA